MAAEAVLRYSSPEREHFPIVEEHADGGVTITVPTRRSAGRSMAVVAGTDLFAFVFAPFVWLAFRLLATRRPRAVLTLTPTAFTVAETNDDGLGLVTRRRTWATSSLGELRLNRFSRGLYLTIPKRDNLDLLTDLPAPTLATIASALAGARARCRRSAVEVGGHSGGE